MTISGMLHTDSGLVFTMDGETKLVNATHPNYTRIIDAVKAGDLDMVEKLIDVAKVVAEFGTTDDGTVLLKVEGGVVKFKGEAVSNALTRRILAMVRDGFDVNPLVNFLANLELNPSFRAVKELYGFLEATDLPLTPDGCFIAYKMVTRDYKDRFTGTFDNSIGAVVKMDRNKVDEDSRNTCSYGLHVCSQAYLNSYFGGPRTLIVKVNPADVVAVPADYNNAKMRVCKYEVTGELNADELPEDGDGRKDHSFGTSVLTDKATAGLAPSTAMTMKRAEAVLCGDTLDPAAALRKRIARGSVKIVLVEGEEWALVKDKDLLQ